MNEFLNKNKMLIVGLVVAAIMTISKYKGSKGDILDTQGILE